MATLSNLISLGGERFKVGDWVRLNARTVFIMPSEPSSGYDESFEGTVTAIDGVWITVEWPNKGLAPQKFFYEHLTKVTRNSTVEAVETLGEEYFE